MVRDPLQHAFGTVVNLGMTVEVGNFLPQIPGQSMRIRNLELHQVLPPRPVKLDEAGFVLLGPMVGIDIQRGLIAPGAGQSAMFKKIIQGIKGVFCLRPP